MDLIKNKNYMGELIVSKKPGETKVSEASSVAGLYMTVGRTNLSPAKIDTLPSITEI